MSKDINSITDSPVRVLSTEERERRTAEASLHRLVGYAPPRLTNADIHPGAPEFHLQARWSQQGP